MSTRVKTIRTFPFQALIMRLLNRHYELSYTGGTEQRKYPRVPISIRVTNETSGSYSYYHAGNISAGGMFLKSLEPLTKGSSLELSFGLLPFKEEIRVKAEVMWSRPYRRDSGDPPGMGVKFTRISKEDEQAIKRFVAAAP